MITRVITKIDEATGASIRNVDNWIARLPLNSEFEPTKRGRSRRFTFENALEIALISDLTGIGLPASQACRFAHMLIAMEPEHDGFNKYWSYVNGNLETLQHHLPIYFSAKPRKFRTLVVLQPGKIRDEVRKYFDENSVEADMALGLR